MEISLCCYGSELLDDDVNSAQVCLVNHSVLDALRGSDNNKPLFFVFNGGARESGSVGAVNNTSVCLQIYGTQTVEETDMVVPEWVMKVLLLSAGSSVRCQLVQDYTETTPDTDGFSYRLEYLGYTMKSHWDTPHFTADTKKISLDWPAQLSLYTGQKLNQVFASSQIRYCLHENSVIRFIHDQFSLFFLVRGFNCSHAIVLGRIVSNIWCDVPSRENATVTPLADRNNHLVLDLTSWQVSLLRLAVMLGIPSMRECNSKSVLVCGAEGSGKSSYLSSFCQKLFLADFNCSILQMSIANLDSSKHPKTSDLYLRLETMTITDLVAELETICGCRRRISGASPDEMVLIVIIEDIDALFGFDEIRDGESSALELGSVNNELMMTVGALLRKLLDRASSCPNTFVLGSCKRLLSTVPRRCQGYPEFEALVSVPRINFADRTVLLMHEFKLLNVRLQQLDMEDTDSHDQLNNDIDDNLQLSNDTVVSQWASRLSGLTPGYLPGDLKSLVGRIVSYSNGRSHTELGPNVTSSAKSAPVSWSAALATISNFAPKSLQALQSDISFRLSDHPGTSWNDFGGYSEVKKRLKRLLLTQYPTRDTVSWKSEKSRSNLFRALQTQFGIVLHGPSGCGKTLLASIIAKEVTESAEVNFYVVYFLHILGRSKSCVYQVHGVVVEVFWTDRSHYSQFVSTSQSGSAVSAALR
jgi:Cdc6-like AAA superfamily ATPase